MGLKDRWKQAESHTKDIARTGWERARESWGDTEQMIRRRMRLFPKQMPPIARPEFQDQSVLRPAGALDRRVEDAERKAIVSVHGQDLSSEEEILDKPKTGTGTAA